MDFHSLTSFSALRLCVASELMSQKASGTEQTSTGGFGFGELHWCDLHSQLQARSAIEKEVFIFSPPAVIAAARHPQRQNQNLPWSCAQAWLTQTSTLRPESENSISLFLPTGLFLSSLLWQLAAVCTLSPTERKQIKHQGFSVTRSKSRLFSHNSADFQLPAPEG